jgi:hypothetical protein
LFIALFQFDKLLLCITAIDTWRIHWENGSPGRSRDGTTGRNYAVNYSSVIAESATPMGIEKVADSSDRPPTAGMSSSMVGRRPLENVHNSALEMTDKRNSE